MPNSEKTPPDLAGSGRKRVLVLESDRLVRALIVEWLAMAGNDALGVEDLAGAAAIPGCCDIVLVDVPAPHRAARLTLMELARVLPGTRVIAMSADIPATGHAACEALARELGANAVLVKPFNQHALLSAIHRVRA